MYVIVMLVINVKIKSMCVYVVHLFLTLLDTYRGRHDT